MVSIIRRSLTQFSSDDCWTLAAALAYYTFFAMPPLLFLLVTIVTSGISITFQPDIADEQAKIFFREQASQLIGDQSAAEEIGRMIENNRHQSGTWWKSLLSVVVIIVGATGLVSGLQSSLNQIWKVKPVEGDFAIRFFLKRLVSLAMILGFGFLLLVSFVVGTLLSTLTRLTAQRLGLEGILPNVINQVVAFSMTWAFFTAVFRFVPDAKIHWIHAAQGGFFTVILFTLGRLILSYYLLSANPAEQFGSAAASIVVILLWVYYSALILLLGAEFTANLNVTAVEPEQGAAHVVEIIR